MVEVSFSFSKYMKVLLTALGVLTANEAVADKIPSWSSRVILVEHEGKLLDVARQEGVPDEVWRLADRSGHAGPHFYDINDDGRLDLLVSTFGGVIRVYIDRGTGDRPNYELRGLLQSTGTAAEFPNYCCLAPGFFVDDIGGDGNADLVGGSYYPGAIYYFEGDQNGSFGSRQILTEEAGIPVFTDLDTISSDPARSFGTKPTLFDWNADGRPDLIIGNYDGDLIVRFQADRPQRGIQATPTQPVFGKFSGGGLVQIEVSFAIDDPLRDMHQLSPVAADWDGDGLVDLVIGAEDGSVHWLRNIGRIGEPVFERSRLLLRSGDMGPQLLWSDADVPSRGIRASIDVGDVDGDGQPDLIVGDYTRSVLVREDLRHDESRILQHLLSALAGIDQEIELADEDREFYQTGYFWPRAYLLKQLGRDELAEKVKELEDQVAEFFVPSPGYENRPGLDSRVRRHGIMRVYFGRSK